MLNRSFATRFHFAAMLCAGTFTLNALADHPPAGFAPIFDGTSLDGWHAQPHIGPAALAEMADDERSEKMAQWMSEAKQHWSVENGELVNDGKGPYLVTNKDYTDYELRLEYKTVPLADSGIYLKGTPQVQIWDYTDEAKFDIGGDLGSGGLWNNSDRTDGKDPLLRADKPLGEWNAFRIVQVGARTTVYLNDVLVVDNAIMENYWDRKSPLFRSGPIELQTHGGEIRWRNLAVKELSADEANAWLSDKKAQSFTSLFNGKDLTGWQGATDNYEVVDGAIVCKKGSGGQLLTEDEYANFVARVEFRLPPGGNNGLAIRSDGKGDAAYDAMTELQVLDSEHEKYENLDSRQYHGSAYGMAAATRGFLRDAGQWNFQEVTVDGSKIKVELNGTVILDTDLSTAKDFLADKKHPGLTRTSGYFGFAGHNDPVEFRNVSIKRLP
ncbi:hypothetical protein Poly51_10300 [Rubripirellula tenax]|uniref:3-keto-alpha-glucoside-1,2-lyase/3-keto-2-hydroxy-glucal hydratase domain-containing protein n=1 Tax=Rubripirellula tenax TaxID=2528015 RepID=A0A5C6FL08_9BACT|nr:DUF1080 domain-containing protein [Rubripirellula tenax]TWU60749.1 hypothetical protein Poly51_10300 [Rubripirellula tenax]